MLLKLTKGFNFTNILLAAFLLEMFLSFSVRTYYLLKKIWQKS